MTSLRDLTAACQECHVVEEATIKRVRADQTTLIRTEFSHRAHVTHAQCLDCHTAIPVREFLNSTDDPAPESPGGDSHTPFSS